jgi:hypothetical protein
MHRYQPNFCLERTKRWTAQIDTKISWGHVCKEMELRFTDLTSAHTVALHISERFLATVFFKHVVSTYASKDFLSPFFQSDAASLKNSHSRAVAYSVAFITVETEDVKASE